MTLNEISYIVFNQVSPHIVNTKLSIDQVKTEVILTRNWLINEYFRNGTPIERRAISTKIDCIPIECKPIVECCGIQIPGLALIAEIPSLLWTENFNPVVYVGKVNQVTPWKVEFKKSPREFLFDRVTAYKTTAWFRTGYEENDRIVIFNPPTYDLSIMSLDVVLEDPRDALNYDCACVGGGEDVNLNMPKWMPDKITGKLIESYLRQYNIPKNEPNTQTDIVRNRQ